MVFPRVGGRMVWYLVFSCVFVDSSREMCSVKWWSRRVCLTGCWRPGTLFPWVFGTRSFPVSSSEWACSSSTRSAAAMNWSRTPRSIRVTIGWSTWSRCRTRALRSASRRPLQLCWWSHACQISMVLEDQQSCYCMWFEIRCWSPAMARSSCHRCQMGKGWARHHIRVGSSALGHRRPWRQSGRGKRRRRGECKRRRRRRRWGLAMAWSLTLSKLLANVELY